MTYLLETSLAVHVMRGNEALGRRLQPLIATGDLAVSAITAAELYYGAWRRHNPEPELQRVLRFLRAFEVVPFDDAAALTYGDLLARLHQSGVVLPTMDVQIAALALAGGLIVLSADKHFKRIPGLAVENWLEPPTEGSS